MPTVQSLLDALDAIAPLALAEDWDNVGLIAGDARDELRGPVLLSIDLTAPLADEAKALGAGAVLAYHPPIFQPIKRLTSADARQALLLTLLRQGLSVVSPHTSLDAAPGAMSDWLADCVLEPGHPRAADRRALVPKALPTPSAECKIVTFVPPAEAERVRGALASAGAGLMGKYQACSFTTPGTGTFLGGAGSKPTVGQPGHLESVPEVRVEMVIARRSIPLAVELLRRFHPYEHPAIDVYPLEPLAERATGAGRRLTLDRPVPIDQIAQRVKANLRVSHVQIAPAFDPARPIARVGVCPGAGADLVDAAVKEGCDLFLTGEMKHHEVLAANAKGLGIMLAGHSNTERGYLPLLAARLNELVPGLDARHASSDRMLMQTV
jgi:dinuclear metal center YbgI/SA1388 family protein